MDEETCLLLVETKKKMPLITVPHLIERINQSYPEIKLNKSMFVLETKTAPNDRKGIKDVYPQIDIPSSYSTRKEAKTAKSELKNLMLGEWKNRLKKFPIRIREIK